MKVLTTGNPEETKFRQRLDALNGMMADQRIPQHVRRRVRDYFRRSKQLTKRLSYFGLIDATVSTQLKTDLRLYMSRNTFAAVWWLNDCETDFLEELSKFTHREAYAMEEAIPTHGPDGNLRLMLLVNGVACRGGAILTTGACWGDILLTVPRLRDMRPAKALNFCELVVLSANDLQKMLPRYPESHKIIRQAALKLATRRMFILIAMYGQLRKHSTPQEAVEIKPVSPSLSPIPAIEAKARGLTQQGGAVRKTTAAPVIPDSPADHLKALNGLLRNSSDAKWQEPDALSKKQPGSPATPSRPRPSSEEKVQSGGQTLPASVGVTAGPVTISLDAKAVISRLDSVEKSVNLMLVNMAAQDKARRMKREAREAEAREAKANAALLAAQATQKGSGGADLSDQTYGGDPLAA